MLFHRKVMVQLSWNMARSLAIFQCILSILTWSACWAFDVDLETQLQKLTEKYNILTARVTQLEAKLQEQELIALGEIDIGASNTRINYGHNKSFKPRQANSKLPSSCLDLKMVGHQLSGLYSIIGAKQVETVYCDFSKPPTDSTMQTRIGSADIKSVPTYFYVQRNTFLNQPRKTPISYEVDLVNIGGAMNISSGIFTAPVAGLYFFSMFGMARSSHLSKGWFNVNLMVNGNNAGSGHADGHFLSYSYDTYSLLTTTKMQVGDKVWLEIDYVFESVLNDTNDHFTHFMGWLLEEDISQSLSIY